MNIDAAKSFALDYLTNFIGPKFHYHNMAHALDVFQSVSILAMAENIKENDLVLLQTAALYHDLGIHIDYFKHEAESNKIVRKALPDFGFSSSEINRICALISDTCLPCPPHSKMGELLCDADLDYLGRDDYFEIADRLRKEWEECDIKCSTEQEWYVSQLDFLENHHYNTDSAKKTRNEGKQKNIDRVTEILINL
jgi:uncharacterized protein